MKYAILDPKGRVLRVVDKKPDDKTSYHEITDQQAQTIETVVRPDYYAVFEGELVNREKLKELRKAKDHENFLNQLTPEQKEKIINRNKINEAYFTASDAYQKLSLGKRALWEPVRAAVAEAINAGEISKAKEILQTTPAIYQGAENDRAAFLSIFP